MGSIPLSRASTGEMLPRARRQIHPPQQQRREVESSSVQMLQPAFLQGNIPFFSFGNNFSCSASLGFFCSLSYTINLVSSESQTQMLSWSCSESLPGLSFGGKHRVLKCLKATKLILSSKNPVKRQFSVPFTDLTLYGSSHPVVVSDQVLSSTRWAPLPSCLPGEEGCQLTLHFRSWLAGPCLSLTGIFSL